MNVGSSDNIHMYLYNDDLNHIFGELNSAESIGAAGNYMFTPDTPLVMPAGMYALVIEPDFVEGTSMTWFNANEDQGGEYSEAVGTTWGPWNNVGEAGTFRVYGTVVPEPSTIALFLLGVSCIILKRKIKR